MVVDITQFPSIPRVLLDLITACRRVEFNTSEILSIALQDLGICGRILFSTGNTRPDEPFRADFLQRMISELGPGGIKSIAIHATTCQFFTDPAVTMQASLFALWKQSIACALRAKALAQYMDYPSPEEAYLSGLFHVLGETVSFGLRLPNHPANTKEAGAVIAEPWGLRGMVADAVRYQREPVTQMLDAHILVKILNVACRLEDAKCTDADPGYDAATALLQIERTTLYDLLCRVDEDAQAIFNRLGLSTQGWDTPQMESQQLDLARQVQNFALLSAAGRDFSNAFGEPQILAAIGREVATLFCLGKTLVFRFNADNNLLYALDDGQVKNFAAPFQIRLVADSSLVSEALLQRKPLNSHANSMQSSQSVVDKQLTRFLGREGIACIPLVFQCQRFGAIVAGIDACQLEAFEKRMDLLQDFGELAAATLHNRPPH